jgi:hypothetical protein
VLGLLGLGASVVSADSVTVGAVSFDTLNPGATDAFTVYDFTGANSLFPDFPVVTNLTFLGATITPTDASGSATNPLGDLTPGSSQLAVLASDTFFQAVFQATLSQTVFALGDGTTFQANSNLVSLTLLPSSGSSLQPDVDFALMNVNGSVVTAPVPEPPTWLLLLTAIVCIAACKRVARPSQS